MLTNQMLAKAGDLKCEIALYDSTDNSRLTSTAFTVKVHAALTSETQIPDDDNDDDVENKEGLIAFYEKGGTLPAGEPKNDNHVTTKKYVDDKLDGKLNKVTSSVRIYPGVYATGSTDGTPQLITATSDLSYIGTGSGYIPLYASGGQLKTAEPTSDDSAANKKYVDEQIANSEIPMIVCNGTLYATVGHEFVLYYDNILRCMRPENFIVTTALPSASTLSALYPEFDRCLKFTPTSTNIGTHTITIKVINKSTWLTVAEKNVNIIVSADTTRRSRKVMFIGDSLTFASVYAAEITNMSNNGIVSIGTVEHAITFNGATIYVKTEGRNAYASYDYVSRQTAHNYANPFFNPDAEYSLTLDKKYTSATGHLTFDNSGAVSVLKHHFDFAYYMANNSATVGTPDAVFINLGTNGGNGYALSDVYIGFDAMIERIHAYNADLPIFLHLFPPISGRGNDARGGGVRNVRADLDSRVGYYDCIQTLIDRYKNDNRVTIVPVNTMLDRLYDYKLETVPVSARNPIEITIGQSDSTHPANAGYLHMADAYYNALQCLWHTDDPQPKPTYTNINAGAGTVITNGLASLEKCVYQAGRYISTAAPQALNVDANATTFGMMPATDGDEFYVKGLEIVLNVQQPTTTQTHARLGFANYDESTNKTSWVAEHKFYNASSNYVTVTVLDEATKYYKIKIAESTGLTYNYIGLSLDTTSGDAETLIITKGEPIESEVG